MNAETLRGIVNREIHPIRCASSCGRKAQKGLTLGDLCVEAHHPRWALKIWQLVIEAIHDKDYEDWIGVWFNPEYVSLSDVISDGICEIIGRRVDDLNRRCGWYDAHDTDSCEYWAGDGWYDSFNCDKYDYDWLEQRQRWIALRSTAINEQATARIFREGQGELPPQAQDFFHYWADFDPTKQDLNFKIDDWD